MKKLTWSLICSCLAFTQLSFAEDFFAHELIDSNYPNHTIELLMAKPKDQTYQVILFLHGGNDAGLKSISLPHLSHWVEKGYAVAAISMPGFGQSSGDRDFCGPFTIDSLNQAIDRIKDELEVSRLAVIGFGQGGMAATLLSAYRNDLIGIICANGGYDLFVHKTEEDNLFNALKKKGYKLDFDSDEDLTFRSPICHVSEISAPVFILHRNGNPLVSENEVIDFHHAMRKAGKECRVVLKDKMVGDDDMKLSYDEILSASESWLDGLMQQE